MRINELIPDNEIIECYGINRECATVYPSNAKEATDENALVFIFDGVIPNRTEEDPLPFAYVTDKPINKNLPFILVKNARHTASIVYSRYNDIDYSRLKFIGITGTNGKTTTAKIIKQILSDSGHHVGFIGTGEISDGRDRITDNFYSYTTPPPDLLYPSIKILQEKGCDWIVMEISSHALSQFRVSPIRFDIGLFTNLSAEHTDYHPTMEDYFATKMTLLDISKQVIINIDDEYGRRAYDLRGERDHTAGIIRPADFSLTDLIYNDHNGARFTYCEKGVYSRINTPLRGRYNLYNTLMAIACARIAGVGIEDIKKSVACLSRIDGRYEVICRSKTVIIDYAHTPMAMESILKTVNTSKNIGQKIFVVFGCGGNRDRSKRPKMGEIAEKYADNVVITSDNSRNESFDDICKDILLGIKDHSLVKIIENREGAILHALSSSAEGDIVLLLGKGAEKYMISKDEYTPFDERLIVEKYFDGEIKNDS